MNKKLTERDIKKYDQKYKEISDSIDYDKLDFSAMTFEEFKNLVVSGIYVEELKECVIRFIDKREKLGKTVSETLDDLENIDYEEELLKMREEKESYKVFRKEMLNVKDEHFRKMLLNLIDINQIKGADIEQTINECNQIKIMLKNFETGMNCCECGVELKKAYIENKTEKPYCEKCSKFKVIKMTLSKN